MIRRLLQELADAPVRDVLAEQAVAYRASSALRPSGAMAVLDRVAAWLAGWQRSDVPGIDRPLLVLVAGDRAEFDGGPATAALVDAVRAGVATSAVMARDLGVALRLIDVGADGRVGVESDRDRFAELVSLGRETVAGVDTDLLMVGSLGGGGDGRAAVVAAACSGAPPAAFVDGPVGSENWRQVSTAVAAVEGGAPLEILRRAGGPEMAVLAGVAAEARLRSIPVLLDGLVTAAAVAPLGEAVPGSLNHCLAAHRSTDPGHSLLLDHLGMEPLLDLGLSAGEGVGALAALPLVRLAVACVVDVTTYEEWGLF